MNARPKDITKNRRECRSSRRPHGSLERLITLRELDMIYVILYLYRHPLGKIETRAHPLTFDDLETAERELIPIANQFKAPAWIAEIEKPDITPQLKIVK